MIRIQTNFSTLALKPQEFLAMTINLQKKNLTLKQKDSCKYYLLDFEIKGQPKEDELPNVASIFDLWPYLMYYNETKNELANNG
jgi:hypothetical protein